MIQFIKNIFTKTKEKEYIPDPPGRTFKKVLTGRYFGSEDKNADADKILQAKQDKINQINELELTPMFVRYTYDNNEDKNILSANVAFQKEILAEKWNMIHITEISFTVNVEDFVEFEQMSGASLKEDFRDVTPNDDSPIYQGKERRKEKRDY